VTERSEHLRSHSSLEQYSFWDALTIRIADWAFYVLIALIGRTIRFEVRGGENIDRVEDAGRLPVYAVWHDRIFLGTYYFRGQGIFYLTSQSRDGEYIARFLRRFGFGVVRGSSTRGGVAGLAQMIRKMKEGYAMGLTVDGPKGPRYIAKSGAVMIAKKTGNPIIPFIVESDYHFRVKSWDRMQVPRPFSRAIVLIGSPIDVPAEADAELVESKRTELQEALDELVSQGEKWRADTTG
jgi:lysophospholipid acyltransferase (LPLAT)-like uncharacterized protein